MGFFERRRAPQIEEVPQDRDAQIAKLREANLKWVKCELYDVVQDFPGREDMPTDFHRRQAMQMIALRDANEARRELAVS